MSDFLPSSMLFIKNHLASTLLFLMALAVHHKWWRQCRTRWGRALLLGLMGIVGAAFLLEAQRISNLFATDFFRPLHATGLGWSLASLAIFGSQLVDGLFLRLFGTRRAGLKPRSEMSLGRPEARPTGSTKSSANTADTQDTAGDVPASAQRRVVLQAIRGAIYATPAVALGYGTFIERDNFRVEEITIPVAGLPKELEGLKIVQITDIHMGPFMSERNVERIVGMANETRSHLAIMTGDLVTGVGDPVEICLEQLARVRTDAGMIGCLGNHEIYANAQDYVYLEGARLGIRFLRSESLVLEFRGHKLNFAGVDYQRKGAPYLIGAEKMIESGIPNILLSHSPDVFPVAASQGYDLTLSGHTHGGQITVEYLQQFVNPARFVTRYVSGLYEEAGRRIYVSRGLGTVGVPTRLGAPPELTVIRLAAAPKVAT